MRNFLAIDFTDFSKRHLHEGSLSELRARASTILDRITFRISRSLERFGFDADVERSQDLGLAKVHAKAGNYTALITIYDDDDVVVEIPSKTANKLELATYSSFKSPGEALSIMKMMIKRMKEHG